MAATKQRSPAAAQTESKAHSSGGRYEIASVSRAIRILQAFTLEAPRRRVSDIARALALQPTQVEGTLATLEKYGLVRQLDGAYELGLAWLHLSEMRERQFDIRQIALPAMRRIRDAIDETVILTIRLGTRRLNIDYVESTQLTRRVRQPGLEIALHVGAAGRVLLSGFSRAELEQYFASVPLVDHTSGKPISRRALLADLERVRKSGYAVALAEVTHDTAAVAAPIRNHRGEVVAALTVSTPSDRFQPSLEQACIEQVCRAGRDLASLLGYAPGAAG